MSVVALMLLAGLFIFTLSVRACFLLDAKYLRPGETHLTADEFISRANLDDILRMRHHTINGWVAMGMMSIGSLNKW